MSNPRPRRIDDALSQLVDSLLPPLSIPEDVSSDTEEAIAETEEQRHAQHLSRVWHVLDAHAHAHSGTSSGNNPFSPGDLPIASGSGAENNSVINNASDLIKRKLLRENASPDKAVRFSNLYSRLLTQPVLSQKWAILYLLYQLSNSGSYDGGDGDDEVDNYGYGGDYDVDDGVHNDNYIGRERSRSPLLEEANLPNMLFRDQRARTGTVTAMGTSAGTRTRRGTGQRMGMTNSDDEGPAISSSASQKPVRMARSGSVRLDWEEQRENDKEKEKESDKDTARPSSQRLAEKRWSHPHTAEPWTKEKPTEEQKRPTTADKNEKPPEPPEHALLRDLPYNLQGISSSNLKFSSPSILALPPTLPIPIISLLHTLAEPCLLYKGLSSFVEASNGGLVIQSLRAAISNELRSYLGLVATLEGETRRALAAIGESGGCEPKGIVKGGVTLRRCVVWTRDATMALRLLSLIVEEAQDKKGGQLISLIHGFSSSHGDTFVCAFAEKLLTHITRPFYDMLRLWIYDGELSDPYREFFVVEPEFRPSTDPRRIATSVWEDKYDLDDNMVPSIITQEFAKKVFLIGKSLNFIRYGCRDSAWVEAYSKEASKELRYGDTASLEISIDEAYKTTMARLIYLMDDKFKLFDHLRALKKYLLLGQGDFIAVLMESLASNLDRPANSQYRHTLTAQLEHAIRSSNAQYDPADVLRRLDARMLELSHGEIGWDCFTLEYKIDAPVDVVITPWGSTQYLKVFNFLWRVKRVEFALDSAWRRHMTGARGVLGSVDDKVGTDWKRARCAIAEMIHFICQLQNYILFEVIEASWNQLQAAVSKPGCTLDDLIEAHTKYLNSITHKGLLGSSSSSRNASSASSKHQEESFLVQLHQILKVMLAYKDAVDGLYSFSVAEFTRRQELSAKIETRTAQGRWGISERDLLPSSGRHPQAHKTSISSSPSLLATPNFGNARDGFDTPSSALSSHDLSADDRMLASLRVRLRDLLAEFRSRVNILLGDLAYQPDVDMRFLGVVMNFNDVYHPVRRRRTTAQAASNSTNAANSRDKDRARRKVPASTSASASTSATGRNVMDGSSSQKRETRRESLLNTGNGSSAGTGA